MRWENDELWNLYPVPLQGLLGVWIALIVVSHAELSTLFIVNIDVGL